MRGADGNRIWKYKIAMRDTAFSASKRVMSMLAVRGDERAAKVMYNLVTNRPLMTALRKLSNEQAGMQMLALAERSGIREEELIGEYPTNKQLPWEWIETYTDDAYLRRYCETIKRRAEQGLVEFMPDEKIETLTATGDVIAAKASEMPNCSDGALMDGRLMGASRDDDGDCFEFDDDEDVDAMAVRSLPVLQ